MNDCFLLDKRALWLWGIVTSISTLLKRSKDVNGSVNPNGDNQVHLYHRLYHQAAQASSADHHASPLSFGIAASQTS